MLDQTIIKGRSINDTWFKAMKATMELGVDYRIDKGEYEGQFRRELDLAVITLSDPGQRPLACQMQNILPTTDAKIHKYFQNYILDPDFTGDGDQAFLEYSLNEYKYSTWIGPSWQHCCDLLLQGEGGCNQATISIGSAMKPDQSRNFYDVTRVTDLNTMNTRRGPVVFTGEVMQFEKPPCLRLVDMRIREGTLHFIIYFRSWDLVGGFPENIGGLQLLKEFCLEYMNLKGREYEDGSIIAVSKGLHIYDHYWDTINNYVGNEEVAKVEMNDFGIWTV